MEEILRVIARAAPERVAVLLCIFFICLLTASIRVLWNRLREKQSEIDAFYEAQTKMTSCIIRLLLEDKNVSPEK